MNNRHLTKLFPKLNLLIIAVFMFFSFVAVTLIATILYNKIKGQQKIISIKQAIELASNYGNFIKNSIEKDLIITQTLANNVSNFNEIPCASRRACFKATHKITFFNNPQIYNLFTVCEKNSIDQNDKDNQRFYYSTFRTNPQSFFEKSKIYYNPDGENWYKIPKNTLEDYISEPYFWKYPYGTDSILEISIISPIISNGKFLGIVGIDKRLDTLQKELAPIKPFNAGYVFLISNNGMLVSYPNRNLIGSNFLSTLTVTQKKIVEKSLKEGYSETFHYTNENNLDYLAILLPVKFGNSKKYWSIGISIPYEIVLKPVIQNLVVIIIVSSVAIFILIFFILVLWNRTLNKKVEERTTALKIALIKAEEASRLKTAFLANISHEIRTPLNGILGFSDLLISDDIAMLDKQKSKTIIKNCVERLLMIMDDILDISKIQSEQLEIIETDNNIVALISEIETEIKQKIKQSEKNKFVSFSAEVEIPEAMYHVRTDFRRLKQVLDKVLDNAIKFTDSGSIKFLAHIKNNKIIFEISDTGKGISAEKIPIVFDSFRQGSEGYNSGTGLGLSIAKGIVQLLKGDIYIESDVNKGTKIYITIPYHKAKHIK